MRCPERWVSIDPGDIHVGLASWTGYECVSAIETTPEGLEQTLEHLLEGKILDHVVYEKFALYGWNEKSMAGNEFETSQLIGVIKYLCRKHGVPYTGQFASEHKRIYKLGWYVAMTRKERMQLPWWGNGGHAMDAWCAGAWFVRKRQQE